jgi:hypothetical protein
MSADNFIHLYCGERHDSMLALCGYYGPDEPPGADELPKCPDCEPYLCKPCPDCEKAEPA